MSPLRWDVLLVGFVLALPVLALGLRGDLTTEEVMIRLLVVPRRGLGRGRAAALRQHSADDGAEREAAPVAAPVAAVDRGREPPPAA